MNNNIIMNDSMSILLATTVLALGGLGLYMYKSSEDSQESDEYIENNIFGNMWGSSDDNQDEKQDDKLEENADILEELEEEYFKPRRRNTKTQRNRKSKVTSRRRY